MRYVVHCHFRNYAIGDHTLFSREFDSLQDAKEEFEHEVDIGAHAAYVVDRKERKYIFSHGFFVRRKL